MTATKGRLFASLEDSFDEVVSTIQTVPRRSTSISHTGQSMSPKIALLRKRFLSLSHSDRPSGELEDQNVEDIVFTDPLETPWQSPLTNLPLNRVRRNASTESHPPMSSCRRRTLTQGPSFKEFSMRVEQIEVRRSQCCNIKFQLSFSPEIQHLVLLRSGGPVPAYSRK